MAQRLGQYTKYHDPTLVLGDVPGRDKVERDYTIPEPSAELGLWCQGLAELYGRIDEASTAAEIAAAVEALNDLPELDSALTLAQKLMGSAYDQMMADGVSHPAIQHCAGTVYAWIVGGEPAAERYWTAADRPEASGPVPNRADRRKHQRAGSSRTTSTDAASTTPSRGSGTGTRSRSRSRRRDGRPRAG